MTLIELDKNRDDGPSIVLIAVICVIMSLWFESIPLMILGLLVFTLCGIQMIFRPSYSSPDYGLGCIVFAVMSIIWSIILLEFYYSDDYIRSIIGYIIWTSIILSSILYLIVNKKINEIKYR